MFDISTDLVIHLIKEQFPQWADLTIKPVARSGHDNRTFHLGTEMTVRLPSGQEYIPQIEKEAKWLPFLSKNLSLPISCPIALGKPSDRYPSPWSVNKYLKGDPLNLENIKNPKQIATKLSSFLQELQGIPTNGAPIAGKHNFFRGENPGIYSEQVDAALYELKPELPVDKIHKIWEDSISSQWQEPPVWIHGDIAPGNLLVSNGKLCGVIDFGIMGIGDPSCDYAMAWTFFDSYSRSYFLQGLDKNTIKRAKAWALWKALITYHAKEAPVSESAHKTLNAILSEYDEEKI